MDENELTVVFSLDGSYRFMKDGKWVKGDRVDDLDRRLQGEGWHKIGLLHPVGEDFVEFNDEQQRMVAENDLDTDTMLELWRCGMMVEAETSGSLCYVKWDDEI
jgi:hypothetical protein